MKSPLSHFLIMDLRRSILSRRFAVLTLLIPFVMMLCVGETFVYTIQFGPMTSQSVLFKLQEILTFDRFKPVIVILTTALYTSALGDDITTGFIQHCLVRGSEKSYGLAKLMANALCINLSMVIGFFLYVLIASLFLPLRDVPGGNTLYTHMQTVTDSSFPLLYPLLAALQLAAFVVLLATISCWVCLYHPSRYLAVAVPFALFYIFYTVTFILPRPFWVWYISSSEPAFPNLGFLPNVLYGLAFFWLPSLLVGAGCLRSFERSFHLENL